MTRPKRTFDANTRRKIAGEYRHGFGLVAIAEDYKTSAAVIRRVLTEAGVEVRGRGRPAVSV